MGLVVHKVVDSSHKFAESESNLVTHKHWIEYHLHLLVVHYGCIQKIFVLRGMVRLRIHYVS
jgi:hypothetical protein